MTKHSRNKGRQVVGASQVADVDSFLDSSGSLRTIANDLSLHTASRSHDAFL